MSTTRSALESAATAEGALERDAPVLPRGDRPDDEVGADAEDRQEIMSAWADHPYYDDYWCASLPHPIFLLLSLLRFVLSLFVSPRPSPLPTLSIRSECAACRLACMA